VSNLPISPRKRLAMGHRVEKRAEGGMVVPRVGGSSVKSFGPDYADGVVANSDRPKLDSRAGVKHGATYTANREVSPLTKQSGVDKGTVGGPDKAKKLVKMK
jgi:hypothetical protein